MRLWKRKELELLGEWAHGKDIQKAPGREPRGKIPINDPASQEGGGGSKTEMKMTRLKPNSFNKRLFWGGLCTSIQIFGGEGWGGGVGLNVPVISTEAVTPKGAS